jgi:hypothetical protein
MNWDSSGAMLIAWNFSPAPKTAVFAAVPLGDLPSRQRLLRLLVSEGRVAGEQPGRDGGVAEELCSVLFSSEAEADGVGEVGDW